MKINLSVLQIQYTFVVVMCMWHENHKLQMITINNKNYFIFEITLTNCFMWAYILNSTINCDFN